MPKKGFWEELPEVYYYAGKLLMVFGMLILVICAILAMCDAKEDILTIKGLLLLLIGITMNAHSVKPKELHDGNM
jgi:hypothetical protein